MTIDLDRLEALEKAAREATSAADEWQVRLRLAEVLSDAVKAAETIRLMLPVVEAARALYVALAADHTSKEKRRAKEENIQAAWLDVGTSLAALENGHEVTRLRTHQKGIVQGSSPTEIAAAIIAEHDDNKPRGASADKLDDELCRVCALAGMVQREVAKADTLRTALEEIKANIEARGDDDSGTKHVQGAVLAQVYAVAAQALGGTS